MSQAQEVVDGLDGGAPETGARAAAVRGKIATGLPVVGSVWVHPADPAVRVGVVYYKGCKVCAQRLLADGTLGLAEEYGLRRFLATFVPETR